VFGGPRHRTRERTIRKEVGVPDEIVLPESDFEAARTVTDPVAVSVWPFAEYTVWLEKEGYRPARLVLGEYPRSSIRMLDFIFAPGIVVQALADEVGALLRRLFRVRGVRLRPIGGKARSGCIPVKLALRCRRTEAVLRVAPAQPVDVRIVRRK
jgi:hypothetical protein